MSVPIGSRPGPAAPAAPDPQHARTRAQDQKTTAAARQFEGLLLQQVLKALWETAPGLSGPSAGMYQQMFQGPLADHLAAGGGIGLRPMLERALRNDPNAAPQTREAGALTPMLPP